MLKALVSARLTFPGSMEVIKESYDLSHGLEFGLGCVVVGSPA